jgi:hypothetical protein
MGSKFRALVLGATLLMGALGGVPMCPEEIEEIMRSTHQPKIECAIPDESDKGEPDEAG